MKIEKIKISLQSLKEIIQDNLMDDGFSEKNIIMNYSALLTLTVDVITEILEDKE
jgi:hypothetical protein